MNDDRQRMEERVARLLAADSLVSVRKLYNTFNKIVENILMAPEDEGKRRLRVDNKAVNSLLRGCGAALSTFQLFGFQQVEEIGGNLLILRDPFDSNELLRCSDWLSDQVALCESWHQQRDAPLDEPCAETVVKIRYQENKFVQAGFSALDTVLDVVRFTKTLYSPDVADSVVIRETHNTHNIAFEDFPLTLAEKDWGRGVVLVSTARSEPVAITLGQRRLQAEAKQLELKEERLKREREIATKRADDDKARTRAVQQFHADRERKRSQNASPAKPPVTRREVTRSPSQRK